MVARPTLTDVELAEAQQLLVAKGGNNIVCEVCKNRSWALNDLILTPMGLGIDGKRVSIQLGGKVMPSVALSCTNCGNTKLLNLKILGLKSFDV